MELDYSRKIKINKHRLDEEAERLPADYYDVCKREVEAAEERDLMASRLELKIRSMPIEEVNKVFACNFDRITDKAIKALMDADEGYSNQKKLASLLNVARRSFERKYGMVEVLSYLYRAGLFYIKGYHYGEEGRRTDGGVVMTEALKRKAQEMKGNDS